MKWWHDMIKEETLSEEVDSIRGGCGKKWTENISESLLELSQDGCPYDGACVWVPHSGGKQFCVSKAKGIYSEVDISGGLPKPLLKLISGPGPTQHDAPGPKTGEPIHCIQSTGFHQLYLFSDSSSKSALPSAHWAPEIFDTKGKTWHFVCLLNFSICRLAQRRLGCIPANRCSSMHSCGKVKHKLALNIIQILFFRLGVWGGLLGPRGHGAHHQDPQRQQRVRLAGGDLHHPHFSWPVCHICSCKCVLSIQLMRHAFVKYRWNSVNWMSGVGAFVLVSRSILSFPPAFS